MLNDLLADFHTEDHFVRERRGQRLQQPSKATACINESDCVVKARWGII